MRIKKIHLKDYKRFHDLTIDLGDEPKRIVALVGPNGCGKSSVFDGMLYVNHAYQQLGAYKSVDYKYHSLEQNSEYNSKNLDIIFDQGSLMSCRESRKTDNKQNTIFSFRSSFRYNGALNVKKISAVSDLKNNDYGAYYASDIDQRIEQNYRRLKIKYDNYLNEQDCRPSQAKAHIIGELNNAIGNCLQLQIDNLGNVEDNKGTFFFKKADTEKVFESILLYLAQKVILLNRQNLL